MFTCKTLSLRCLREAERPPTDSLNIESIIRFSDANSQVRIQDSKRPLEQLELKELVFRADCYLKPTNRRKRKFSLSFERVSTKSKRTILLESLSAKPSRNVHAFATFEKRPQPEARDKRTSLTRKKIPEAVFVSAGSSRQLSVPQQLQRSTTTATRKPRGLRGSKLHSRLGHWPLSGSLDLRLIPRHDSLGISRQSVPTFPWRGHCRFPN